MSQPEEKPQEAKEEQQNKEKEEEVDPNALTEEDKKVYHEILSSISRMNKKIKTAKDKVPEEETQLNKRTTVNEIAEKLIESKERSDIITKENLVSDVHQTFEEVVVDVYSQNEQLKKRMAELIGVIKEQNHKIHEYRVRQEKFKQQNQKLRQELVTMKDEMLMGSRSKPPPIIDAPRKDQRSRVMTDNQSEDYDFWTMPQNEGSSKKRKDFVADSNLWVNQKEINESVFITDQSARKK